MQKELKQRLFSSGVQKIQTQSGHRQPLPLSNKKKYKTARHYTGQKSNTGIIYSVRNVKFEPYERSGLEVKNALQKIELAFQYNKPAVISTHRINYVGGLSEEHKQRNLKLLEELIVQINKKWHDVEYITSEELSKLMNRY